MYMRIEDRLRELRGNVKLTADEVATIDLAIQALTPDPQQVDHLREILNAADGDYSAREFAADAGRAHMEPGDWFRFIAEAAIAAGFTRPTAPRHMTQEEIRDLPIGSVVMTVTDVATFGLYEQRVWEKFGGARDWQFGRARHQWQSTDGGFQRVSDADFYDLFTNRKIVVLHRPDATTTANILGAHDAFRATRTRRGIEHDDKG